MKSWYAIRKEMHSFLYSESLSLDDVDCLDPGEDMSLAMIEREMKFT